MSGRHHTDVQAVPLWDSTVVLFLPDAVPAVLPGTCLCAGSCDWQPWPRCTRVALSSGLCLVLGLTCRAGHGASNRRPGEAGLATRPAMTARH